MCKKCITTALLTLLIVTIVYLVVIGRNSYTNKDIVCADTVKVELKSTTEFRNKYGKLIQNHVIPNKAIPDSSQIVIIKIVGRADDQMSDKDTFNRIEQFYYNTHDKLLSTLAIFLTVFSILIAFFGGLIPYMRSEKAEKLLDEVKEQYAKSLKTQENLEVLQRKFPILEKRLDSLTNSLKEKADEIRDKLGKIVYKYYQLEDITEETKKTLERVLR